MSVGKGSISRVNNICNSIKNPNNLSHEINNGNILDIDKLKAVPEQWFFYDNSCVQLEDLKTSIKKFGVLEPVIVRTIDNGGFQLLSGYKRVKAAMEVGLTQIRCSILYDLDTESAKEIFLELHKEKLPANQFHKAKFTAINKIKSDLPDYLL